MIFVTLNKEDFDPAHRPQLRFIWNLSHLVPDRLLQELTLGIEAEKVQRQAAISTGAKRSRLPSDFGEFRKAYSYAVGVVRVRIVAPEHQRFQVQLAHYLKQRNIRFEAIANDHDFARG
jgi:hypothetical protein